MFRFIHAADLHLDSPLRGLESYPDAPVEQIRGATRRALDNLVDLAIEEKVAFVLLAGDIYDGNWKDYHTGLFFAQRAGRLREAGIRVFIISGNHDAESVVARTLRPPENVHIFPTGHAATVHLEELGVAIHGQGYRNRETRTDLAAAYPLAEAGLFNIGLLHTALTGRPGHEPYAPTTLDILRSKGYDYWALGHVHQREIVCRSPWIVFPGCPQGRHIRETGSKGCVLVTVEEGKVSAVEERELDVLRWQECRVNLSGCENEESLFHTVRQQLAEAREDAAGRAAAIRLILSGITPLHHGLHRDPVRWTEECRAMAASMGDLWLEKVILDTRHPTEADGESDEGSPLAELIDEVQELDLCSNIYEQLPELAEIQARLPPELTGGDDPFDLRQPEELARIREDVRELLLARLRGQGRTG